ncbi:MAG: metallopeptidase TldD-related protein [Planctomycetota bacterium]
MMSITNRLKSTTLAALLTLFWAGPVMAVDETLPDSEVLMQALSDELARSMDLQLEDLDKPYFILFMVDDSLNFSLSAKYGAITGDNRDRSRRFNNQVRVGSYELDNTNFSGGGRGGFSFSPGGGRRRGGGGGGRTSLPLDDDYIAIRQAIWWATDSSYKEAVETLTQKRAYMKDKKMGDRPHDFTPATGCTHIEPQAKLSFDEQAWKKKLKDLSGRFRSFPKVQDSAVNLIVGASHQYIVDSEGARIRTARNGTMLIISAEVQAKDGMMLSDQITFFSDSPEGLPEMEALFAKIDELVGNLSSAMDTPVPESYMGPVLFEGVASAQLFQALLAPEIAGQVEPVGSQRSRRGGGGGLENKIDKPILPETFQAFDDPSLKEWDGAALLGHYTYDAEGTPAQRVNLVEDGELKTLLMSRVPTKVLSGSNGHAQRATGSNRISTGIANLIIEDSAGIEEAELKAALLETAKEQGLEFGICVRKINSGSMPNLSSASSMMSFVMNMQREGDDPAVGDPVLVYKVYVNDGREELLRGCEFGQIKVRDLKDISAAGKTTALYNHLGLGRNGSRASSSLVAPSVLFEELELSPIEAEHAKAPLLGSPFFR